MDKTSQLVCFVNGKKVTFDDVDPEQSLAKFLRKRLRLTGTKVACNQGGCGACTVMVSKVDRGRNTISHKTVNACLIPAVSVHGLAITTVEGIGSTKSKLHAVQERIAKSHGSQCGFCTPGMVMSMYTLLRNNALPTEKDIETAVAGNLCRCTGYRPILEGFKTFSKDSPCQMGANCCKNKPAGSDKDDTLDSTELVDYSTFMIPFDPSQEPIFPSELQLNDALDKENLVFRGDRTTWYRPTSIQELQRLRQKFPGSVLVAGNTRIGLDLHMENAHYPVMIALSHVAEFHGISTKTDGVSVGACITVSELIDVLDRRSEAYPDNKARFFKGISEMMKRNASRQIRNTATIGGSIWMALSNFSNSDVTTSFTGAGCSVTWISKDGKENTAKMDANFFKTPQIGSTDVLKEILIPFSKKNQHFHVFKHADRSTVAFAIVNAAMSVTVKDSSDTIEDMDLVYGGVLSQVFVSTNLAKVSGRKLSEDALVIDVGKLLIDEVSTGGTDVSDYKKSLMTSMFFKFLLTVRQDLQAGTLAPAEQSALTSLQRGSTSSTQLFEQAPTSQSSTDFVGRPLVHKAASQQATGEAFYVDDITRRDGELFVSCVRSTKAHARIVKVDATEALSMPGVECFLSHTDLKPERNSSHGAELFASQTVQCVSQAIGVIVADSEEHAKRAANKVKVEYEVLVPLLDLKEAIEKKSFYDDEFAINKGDVDANWAKCDHIVEDEVTMGNQEHFYMETNAVLVIPSGEDDELEIIASSQYFSAIKQTVSHALGVSENKINVKAKRIGGGFGGKEGYIADVSAIAALAAHKLNRPVRWVLERAEDMSITGCRVNFLGKYKMGFDKEGNVLCYECNIFSHQGCASGVIGPALLQTGMYHNDSSYRIPNLRVTGRLVKTNRVAASAFRGFGAGEGAFITEAAITKVAAYLSTSPEKIMSKNLYQEGDLTHCGTKLENCHIKQCWDQCMVSSEFEKRTKEIEQFNKANRWKKRGLAMTPCKHGVGYAVKFLNQGGALVHVYVDGSVLLTHGGVEMGQGIHTKMIQVASRELGIPESMIHIAETNTDKVPNTSPSAGSNTADVNGMAVLDACRKIRERIEPYKAQNPTGNWQAWVGAAYFTQTYLSASGFYKNSKFQYDWTTHTGDPYYYFTFGVACSEAEIDCLTGEHRLVRTDIVMDIGKSLNPAIDIGQIEGGFMQGYGWCTMESVKINKEGEVVSNGPNNYKIPAVADIPQEFNVSLLKNVPNVRAVYSSKGVGEPPFHLGMSAFFAINKAVTSARSDYDQRPGDVRLEHPASVEAIRMCCSDQFTTQVTSTAAST